MARLQRTIKAIMRACEQSCYVTECSEVPVVTGDEVIHSLREAIDLHLAGEDLAALGLEAKPTIIVTIELSPADA